MKKTTLSRSIAFLCGLTAAFTIGIFSGTTAFAAGNIAINDTNFPDETFRDWILSQYYGSDGVLTQSEIKDIKEINLSFSSVKDFKGIEYFTALEKFNCQNNWAERLDVSKNTALKNLNFAHNNISSIDLSKNINLEELNCFGTLMKKLDLSKCTALKYVYTGIDEEQHLTEINVSGCKNLIAMACNGNKLKSLDVSKNTKLEALWCENNQLTNIDVSKNTSLVEFWCNNNKLTSLDVSKNTKLKVLRCGDNEITDLDVSECISLESLYCGSLKLKSVDGGNNSKLSYVDVVSRNIVVGGKKITFYNCPKVKKAYEEGKRYRIDYTDTVNNVTTFTYYQYECYGDNKMTFCIYKDDVPEFFTATKAAGPITVICGGSFTVNPASVLGKGSYTYKISDTKILSGDSKGIFTGKMAGSVTLTIANGEKKLIQPVIVLYRDVTNKNDFWYEPTNYLTAAGVVKGYDNQTLFKPANECSRAQMVTFLWRLSGSPNPKSKTTTFKDIETSDYFYKPVLWAVEKGITTGVTKEKFNPKGICTRAQTVTFLWRMANKPEPKAKTSKFTDIKAKDYFYKAAIWASERKILAGYADNTFRPDGHCLRRQMVTFLYKYDKYINGKG